MARNLKLEITGDSRSIERAFSRSSAAGRKFSIGLGTVVKSAAVFSLIDRAIDGTARALGAASGEWQEQVKVAAQTGAVLQSTGAIANVTERHVTDLATAIQRKSGLDDEAVQSGENLLLTFKNVRNEVGKGNDVFDRATKAAVDLSVAGFGSITATSKQLGKALNDPVRGMTALGRAGVTFTESQKRQIAALVKSNDLLGAQRVILREVESQVGGSARALGQTLPGQLSRLRESLRNTLGGIVADVAPALTAGLGFVNRFIDDLAVERTVRGKLRIVFDRVVGLAESVEERVGDAVANIDWDAVWAQARGVGDGLQARLEAIDFSKVGRTIGDGIASSVRTAIPAAKELATRIGDAVGEIDFVKIGKAAGPGLAAAIATAFVTLLDPGFWAKNWDLALAVGLTVFGGSLGKIAGRLLRPLAEFGRGIIVGIGVGILEQGGRLGAIVVGLFEKLPALIGFALTPLTRIVGAVFGRLGKLASFTVKVLGIQAAIQAVAGVLDRIRDALNGLLGFVREWATRVALKVVEPFTHLPSFLGSKAREAKERLQAQLAGMSSAARSTATEISDAFDRLPDRLGAAFVSAGARATSAIEDLRAKSTSTIQRAVEDTPGGGGPGRKGLSAEQRNTFFDDAVGRKLDRVQDIGSLQGQIGSLQKIAGLITQRIAATKDITRRLNLEDKLLDVGRLVKANRDRLTEQFLESAQRKAARNLARRNAAQFGQLGLDAKGNEPLPGVRGLKRQLSTLGDAIQGTFLDTGKTKSILANVRKVLSGGLGAVSIDVRRTIASMLADLNRQLKEHADGPLTKFKKANVSAIAGSIAGLTAAQKRAVSAAFSQVGPGGTVHGSGAGAFGVALAGGGGVVEFHHTTKLDGRTVESSITRHQQKRRRRNPPQKRGPFAGA